MRIADGHHRVPAEQRREQSGLADAGVLILVEDDDLGSRAQLLGDARRALGDPQRDAHLIAVLQVAALVLARLELAGGIEQRRQRGERRDDRGHVGRVVVAAFGRDLAEPRVVLRHPLHRVGVGEVLPERGGEPQHRRRDGVDALARLRQARIVAPDDDLAREQPRGGLAEHDRVAVEADERGVVAEQGAREGVVGRHPGRIEQFGAEILGGIRVRLGHQARRPQFGDPRAHPLSELARGLAREGEAQDLGGPHVAVGDQPERARRHRLGLAAAGARDDERRFERRLDHRDLLLGGPVLLQALGDLDRRELRQLSHWTPPGAAARRGSRSRGRTRRR